MFDTSRISARRNRFSFNHSFHKRVFSCLLAFLSAGLSSPARSQQVQQPSDARTLLQRAWEVLSGGQTAGKLVHYHASASVSQNYQSDRMYPPFLDFFQEQESWFSPQTAVERTTIRSSYPLAKTQSSILLTDAERAFSAGENGLQGLPRSAMQPRFLNPWLVIHDWIQAGNARVTGTEPYRDFPRTVLARQTPQGEQRLFLDPKSGFPVKLEFTEEHYLWGQRRLEYLYTTWVSEQGFAFPGASYQLADGATEISQTIGEAELIAEAAAPSLSLPVEPLRSEDTLPRFLQPLPLQVTPVGPATYILQNPGYREVVTKIGDEVFLLDATQGEQRAREDEEQIAKLFPGKHKITVIVTDLAWPHVSGVRYWVATGATIVAHSTAREFLQRAIDRRWTLAPDFLEQRRKNVTFKFTGVDSRYVLANGALTLHPIDGIGSEGALMAFIPSERFLWASDFIQTVDEPSQYASEVWKAAQREGLRPERTAAEHLNLTPWSKIEELQKQRQTAR